MTLEPPDKGKVLLVDDEKLVRLSFQNDLRKNGYDVESFDSAEKVLPHITPDLPGVLVTDVIMPQMDGLTLLRKVKEIDPEIPVVVMTGKGDIPMAVEAVREGAYEFLEKPFQMELFMDVIRHSMEKRQLILEIRKLRSEIAEKGRPEARIIGRTPQMERIRQFVLGVAETNTDILILGETGTGKDLVARALHDFSPRRNRPYVALNCGALPETIIESELFGHEAGAFTGAQRRRIGKFEYAQGGTVFLDEIESMPLHLQVKLLRVLQERVIERVGSNEPVPVDVRIVAATKVDLKQAGDEGKFRPDLYYRLNVVQLELPPLRERVEDIPYLFQHFVLEASQRCQLPPPTPTPAYLESLKLRPWEGNVRELKNEAEKFVLDESLGLSRLNQATRADPETRAGNLPQGSLKERLAAFEIQLIEEELLRQKGSITKTHQALGIPRQTLCSKMQRYKISRKNLLG